MASLPKKENLNATAADVVNSVANAAGLSQVPRVVDEGGTLADRTPATRTKALQTFRAAGGALTKFPT